MAIVVKKTNFNDGDLSLLYFLSGAESSRY
jgi:hypothetical protein